MFNRWRLPARLLEGGSNAITPVDMTGIDIADMTFVWSLSDGPGVGHQPSIPGGVAGESGEPSPGMSF